MKFELIKDIKINNDFEEVIVYKTGHIFTPDENNLYTLDFNGKIKSYSYEYMISKTDYFKEFKELNSEIVEINNSEDEEVRMWRIQLDVKTSKSKLLSIQKFINENIGEML
jgi:hypothetical protein